MIPPGSACVSCLQRAAEEGENLCSHGTALLFEGEVTGVVDVDLGVRQVPLVGIGAGDEEYLVVPAPNRCTVLHRCCRHIETPSGDSHAMSQ